MFGKNQHSEFQSVEGQNPEFQYWESQNPEFQCFGKADIKNFSVCIFEIILKSIILIFGTDKTRSLINVWNSQDQEFHTWKRQNTFDLL